MNPHLNEEVCLDYLIDELSDDMRQPTEMHLGVCTECKTRVEQYREILSLGLPSIADEHLAESDLLLPWPVEEGQRRLHTAVAEQESQSTQRGQLSGAVPYFAPHGWMAGAFARRSLPIASLATALVLVAAVVGLSIDRSRLKASLRNASGQHSQASVADLQTRLAQLEQEREAVREALTTREVLSSELKEELNKQRKEIDTLSADLLSTRNRADEQNREASAKRDELLRTVEEQQAALVAAEKTATSLQDRAKNDALRLVSLEDQIQQKSKILAEKEGTINEQRQLLAADRDIRDLMGARDLYIAEVYEVGGSGERKKPYGRVFLTKNKSLVFYAYDLDQQPGVKDTSTFQAWGMRGADRKTALNLGIMYADNSMDKRWMLKFDDPKALEEINAVFVTIEPGGGSRVPSGRQVLFAYLREDPNHP